MTAREHLGWLPDLPDWSQRFRSAAAEAAPAWNDLVLLANSRLNFVRTNRLDALLRRSAPPVAAKPVRLAILGSSTLQHLHAGIRVGALRRGVWVTTHAGDYDQYLEELRDPASALHAFAPTAILFAFDLPHLARGLDPGMTAAQALAVETAARERLQECWRLAHEAFGCHILQQTVLPTAVSLMGSNEQRLPGSPARLAARLNAWLRETDADLVAIDAWAAQDGLAAWHDPSLWHHAKQDVSAKAVPLYGDLVARLLAAKQGRSRKALVLDLDNTLWGGVIGDDGLEHIVLGQGSASGEAYVAVQKYAQALSRRGIILAVCSKNDEANALEPFDKHPDMILKRGDIACFKANWSDKAANIRTIAAELNIGIDSLVFLDDNPFERDLVRREIPEVAVPEVGEDPAAYPGILADAGYFEATAITEEDLARTGQYRGNSARESFKAAAADMQSYLRDLDMVLVWKAFDEIGLQRIVQLINKTNQFNLTTKRYDEGEVRAVMDDPHALGLQLRLQDRFGDNGIISILIGHLEGADFHIDTWLMSCRVLGRQVEVTSLALLAQQAGAMGAKRLVGTYIPTAKNGMVRDHYAKLGFAVTEADGASRGILDLAGFSPEKTSILVSKG